MRALRILAVFCTAIALCAPALAREAAPITYASASVQTASIEPRDDDSYGYGNARREGGPRIDLRRRPNANNEQGAFERERVGPPYEINGRWYVPTAEPNYSEEGMASWYGPTFHGQATASGEIFDQEQITAAHPTLPIPSMAEVTNLENGRTITVRINDRGPFVGERLIDLSRRTAEVLGFERQGQARVHVRYLGPAPRLDTAAVPAPVNAAPARFETASAPASGPIRLLPPVETAAPYAAPVAEIPVQAAYSAPTPVNYTPAPAANGYYVQVGAFADLMNAHRLRDALAGAGPVQVEAAMTSQGELFRVRVGPLASRDDAEATQRRLARMGHGDTLLAAR